MAQVIIADLEDTKNLATTLAKSAKPQDCYCLSGDLGAGKTEFSRAFIQALCGEQTITSPTFNIVHEYETLKSEHILYHFDLYRVESPEELEEIGLEEALQQGICIIEWPEIGEGLIPSNAVKIEIEFLEDNKRIITINE